MAVPRRRTDGNESAAFGSVNGGNAWRQIPTPNSSSGLSRLPLLGLLDSTQLLEGPGVARLKTQGFLKGGGCLVPTPEMSQSDAEVYARFGVVGLEF